MVSAAADSGRVQVAGATWAWQSAPTALLVNKRKHRDEEDEEEEEEGMRGVEGEGEVTIPALEYAFDSSAFRPTTPNLDRPKTFQIASESTFATRKEISSTLPKWLRPRDEDYEAHYSSAHVNVCSQCRRVLATPRLLHLHLLEYECHVEGCTRKFSGPFKRRLHLVDLHKFPRKFDFEGVILGSAPGQHHDEDGDETKSWRKKNQGPKKPSKDEPGESSKNDITPFPPKKSSPTMLSENTTTASMDTGIDDLTKSVSSLSLVPRQIRFGRTANRATPTTVSTPRPFPPPDSPKPIPTSTHPTSPPRNTAPVHQLSTAQNADIKSSVVWSLDHVRRVYRDRIPQRAREKEHEFIAGVKAYRRGKKGVPLEENDAMDV
ncbi:hypothetical protein HDU67_006024 [Dinochytrium kinnereticum]|nr:hypothetical protein HDU67_006024 [Dinochytrium kinnereticum]